MNKRKSIVKIIKANCAQDVEPYALTRQQRDYEQVSALVRSRLADYSKALQVELSRLLTDVDFELDVNLCSPTGLESWLAEPTVLLAELALPLEANAHCYLAMDHLTVHNMADLCLGGQLNASQQVEEKLEFSSSEIRICCRLLQKQAQALLQQLFNQHLPVTASLSLQPFRPENFDWLAMKVRLVLAKEAVSWFLWLPVALWSADEESQEESTGPIALLDWRRIPVKGRVQMARRQVQVGQLQRWTSGEILPIELFETMRFQLGKQMLYRGKVAEEADALLFQISDYVES